MTERSPDDEQQESRDETRDLQNLAPPVLDEVVRHFRAIRNDILRYGVWNIRNLTDEEFNHAPDERLLGYFQSDLLETRFVSKGRRVSIVDLWNWFDDIMRGAIPIDVRGERMYLEIHDKDLEKVRKRMAEIREFFPILEEGDLEDFKRSKFKLRRVVMRMTYDIHHLTKRLDKYRKNAGLLRPRGHHGDPAVHDQVEPPPAAIAD